MENATISAVKTNVELVQENISEFIKGNIPYIIDKCTDDVKWSTYKIPGLSFSDTFYGKEGVQEYFQLLNDAISFTSFTASEFLSQGNRVVVLGRSSGIFKTTGKSFENEWCMNLKLKDGKTSEYFLYTDSYQVYKGMQE
jgi:ketosteroid isomerase-like protein